MKNLEFNEMEKIDENMDFKKLAIMHSQQNTSCDTMS